MKKIRFANGTNMYDFFIIPTIRITSRDGLYTFVTVEWLKWYIGVTW